MAGRLRSKRRVNRQQQVLIAERLGRELDCPRCHGADRGRNVSVTRNEDDRRPAAVRKFSLQIQAARSRKLQIEHQAGGRVRPAGFQKFRRRPIRRHAKPH